MAPACSKNIAAPHIHRNIATPHLHRNIATPHIHRIKGCYSKLRGLCYWHHSLKEGEANRWLLCIQRRFQKRFSSLKSIRCIRNSIDGLAWVNFNVFFCVKKLDRAESGDVTQLLVIKLAEWVKCLTLSECTLAELLCFWLLPIVLFSFIVFTWPKGWPDSALDTQ